MDPLIKMYIDRLAQRDYDNAILVLENENLQSQIDELKKELEEFKEIKEIVEEDEKEGD
ncbi:hypothetical protein [uncultured Anaerococcus sp.]|uniref:hypothetical protein n=1 Tax=uncultured Anaerococcus sp. TaxID=293428 RepID=UPI002803AE37|nr:hypothetical protein [uncultured Anaerococcus sp.]